MASPSVVYSVRQGQRFASDRALVVVSCPSCHVVYAIPESLDISAQKWCGQGPKSWSICCPMGHTWHYTGESPEDKIKRAEEALAHARQRAGRLASDLEQSQASLRAQRGAATRARNQRDRAREEQRQGACPCCGKTFKALARHMARVHPEFPAPEE